MNATEETRGTDRIRQSATSDEIIKGLVVDELYWDARVDASKVLVEVDEGIVTLTGHVPTVADRYSAEADARTVCGTGTVENRLQIDLPRLIADGALAAHVVAVLNWSPELHGATIEPSVFEGTVTLRGTVTTYWQKLRAHLITAQVPGVMHVVDDLIVTPLANAGDHQIAGRFEQVLEHRLGPDMPSIHVTVKDGSVTLRGSVPNEAAFRDVQAATERTAGVIAIHNNELTYPNSFHFRD